MAALNDVMLKWLNGQGYTSPCLADARHAFFQANGYTSWRDVYNKNGGTGHLNDWLFTSFFGE